jgi:hypothetical protein
VEKAKQGKEVIYWAPRKIHHQTIVIFACLKRASVRRYTNRYPNIVYKKIAKAGREGGLARFGAVL